MWFELEWSLSLMSLVCWTVPAWPGKIRRHMATLIALGCVCLCASVREGRGLESVLCSSKRRSESAGSLGKVNLAVADGSALISAKELWSVGEWGASQYLTFWEQLFSMKLNIPLVGSYLLDQAALMFHLTLGTPWYRNIRSVPKRAEQKTSISNFCLFVFSPPVFNCEPF